VVFTTLFALGLTGIVRAADHVHLDPGCVLYGALELTPLEEGLRLGTVSVPRVVLVLGPVLLINLAFVVCLFKELQLAAYDPGLATASGFNAKILHMLLMIIVAITAVASFESVGNILVVAMFVVPPAAAYLLTRRLHWMIILSAVIAAASAVLGHLSAITLPRLFGAGSVSTSGMMALCSGLLFFTALFLAPEQGLIPQVIRRRRLSRRIFSEDILAVLYRLQERDPSQGMTLEELAGAVFSTAKMTAPVLRVHQRNGLVQGTAPVFSLTESGRRKAAGLVRSHRLWEHYLASEGQVSVERLHGQAERLEHFTGTDLRERLQQQSAATSTDPHGRPIPDA
jgi:manganese/zinc/iron transport system permease protein